MACTGKMARFMKDAWRIGPRTVVVLQGVKKPEPEKKHKGKERKAKTRYHQMLEKERCLGVS